MSDIVERLSANVNWLMRDGFETSAKNVQCALAGIESLRQQLADAQREAAHWKNNHETEVRRARILKERTDMPIERVQAYERWGLDLAENAELRQQLAASQAREVQLREALIEVESLIEESAGLYGFHLNGDLAPWGEVIEGGRFERLTNLYQALALPQDTAALEAMIAKAGECMRERCERESWLMAPVLRSIHGVTLEDLRK